MGDLPNLLYRYLGTLYLNDENANPYNHRSNWTNFFSNLDITVEARIDKISNISFSSEKGRYV